MTVVGHEEQPVNKHQDDLLQLGRPLTSKEEDCLTGSYQNVQPLHHHRFYLVSGSV